MATPGEIRGEHGPNVSAAEGDTICDSGNNQVFSSCFVHTGEPCVQFFAHVTQTDTCKLAVFFCRSAAGNKDDNFNDIYITQTAAIDVSIDA